ncbi:hypothetical protein TIFTF001_043209 [Ficus carica]|uniref:Uncharacterized protein n=1 Tax=Ficus carica TaxID=3494 RepID=A0AA87Z361_FICCA|nr:hypothetical protein TIFTF001_043209 [Ficus carica]
MRASTTTQSRSSPSPAVLENSTPVPNHGKTTAQPAGCCWGLKNCWTMGSNVSDNRGDESTSKLEDQVAELEREVEKQKELRITYRKKMERNQDYLRYCLQIAQENGFLDLIMQNKDAPPAPQTPTPLHQHSELSSLVDVAKLNGWYIALDEIELQEKIGHGSTANIHKGTWRGLDVAVKCIRPDFF